MTRPPIFVTQPYMPPLEEFIPYLEGVWRNRVLTNAGPYHQQLERELAEFLGVEFVSLFSNATIGLMSAMQALDLAGEVVTTPYSFVATANSILWAGLTPVFADVDPATLNLDPARVEAAITPRTSAILAVHCYGHPCDVDGLQRVADRHGIRIVYDAAHAFGVDCHCGSVLRHGDLSVLSFHATKVFNTFEGGAIISRSAEMKARIDQLRNFGLQDESTIVGAGLNGKLSEVHAAFGLLQLKHVRETIERRGEIDARYRRELARVRGITCLGTAGERTRNFSYFPILVEPGFGRTRDELQAALKLEGIHARRYFFPLISDFPTFRAFAGADRSNLPVAAQASDRVLCLPIYPALGDEQIGEIVDAISRAAR